MSIIEDKEDLIMGKWINVFKVRHHGTTEWKLVKCCFGMFGLYGELDALDEMPDVLQVAEVERYLERGGHVNIGQYEVRMERLFI